MMIENYHETAKEQIKRADHLLYVSLKYTRTVDVIKSIIERLIKAYDCLILDFLVHQEDNIEEDIPESPAGRAGILKKLYSDNQRILEEIEFYMLLRKISRASFRRISEFRKHVALIADVDGDEVHVNMEKITEYYHRVKAFVSAADQIINGENE